MGGKDELSSHNKDQKQKLALQKQITPSTINKHGQLNLLAETSSVLTPIILKNHYMEALKNRKFTKDERNCIKKWMEETPEDRSIIMSEKNGDTVNKFELQCLKANIWVNDAVINFYLRQCLQKSSETYLILSTFFYRTLMDEMSNDLKLKGKYKYENVRKWKS